MIESIVGNTVYNIYVLNGLLLGYILVDLNDFISEEKVRGRAKERDRSSYFDTLCIKL